MIFPVADLLSFISYKFTLSPGDLVLTGTPAGVDHFHFLIARVHFPQSKTWSANICNPKLSFTGVGPVVAGDVITAGLEDLVTITFPVVA